MEDMHHQMDDSSISLRSTVPFIEIDSLYIDLTSCIDEPNSGNCDHFSIRGYASEMREKDWKKCWPFDLDGDHCKSEETTSLLPPFHVPHFRWWRCQNCRKETPAGCEQPSNLDVIGEGKEAMTNTSMNICNLIHPPSFHIEKEKKTEGGEVDSQQISSPGVHTPLNLRRKVKSSLVLEQNKTDQEHKEFIENCEPHCGNEVSEVEVEVELDHQNHKVVDENFLSLGKGKPTSPHCGQPEITILASGIVGEIDQAGRGENDPANLYPAELDESNVTASEYTEFSAEIDFDDYHHTDKSGSLHRRKFPKLRLLADLLNENGNIKANHLDPEEPSSNGNPEMSEGLKEYSGPQCSVLVKKNIRNLGQNMKGKLPLDEGCLPPEVSSSYKINGNTQPWKGDVKTTDSMLGIESENPLTAMGLETKKSLLKKCKMGGKSIHGKKKIKRTQLDACSSLIIPPESVDNMLDISLKNRKLLGGSGDQFLLFGSRIEPSCISKNKNKKLVIDEGSGFMCNGSVSGGDPAVLKEVEVGNNEPMAISGPSVPKISSERELHLSLNSYSATPKNDTKSILQTEHGSPCFLSWRRSTSTTGGGRNRDAETRSPKDLNVPFNYSDENPGRGVHSGLNSKMTSCGTHFLSEKQNSNSHVLDDGWSQLQPMDHSRVNKVENSRTAQEQLAAKMKQGDRMVGKISEQRALDDIPMEIVELMAKNQYERCLDNAENETLSKTGSRKAQIMNFSNAFSNSGLSKEKMSNMWKPLTRNGRNDICTAGDKVGFRNQSSGNCFSPTVRGHFTMDHLHQTPIPSEYTTFVHPQNKPSNGVKFLGSAINENGYSQYSKCTGGLVDQEFSHPRMQTFGVSNADLPISKKNVEMSHQWPETLANHHSYASTAPKITSHSTSINVRTSYPESSSKGIINREPDINFFNLNASNHEKVDGNYGFGNLRRTGANHPFACRSNGIELPQNVMGSLDLYSNETIPAMHLLSLMDAGMQRSEVRGTPKFPKKHHFHDLKAEEISRLDIGFHKTFDSISYASDYRGEIHLPRKSRDSFHAGSHAEASISPFVRNESFEIAADFMGKGALQSNQKEIIKCPTSAWNRGQKSQKSVFTGGVLGPNKGVFPIHSLPKKYGNASSSLVAISGYRRAENPGHHIIDRHGTKEISEHQKICTEFGSCSINKNPAEFSLPEAGNMYMLGAEDLKFSTLMSPEKRSGLINLDGRKRKRNVKRTPVKEHSLQYNL